MYGRYEKFWLQSVCVMFTVTDSITQDTGGQPAGRRGWLRRSMLLIWIKKWSYLPEPRSPAPHKQTAAWRLPAMSGGPRVLLCCMLCQNSMSTFTVFTYSMQSTHNPLTTHYNLMKNLWYFSITCQMCVLACAYACVYALHACARVCEYGCESMCEHMCTCMRACMCVCVWVWVHVWAYVHLHAHVYVTMCMCVQTCAREWVCMRTHVCVCVKN